MPDDATKESPAERRRFSWWLLFRRVVGFGFLLVLALIAAAEFYVSSTTRGHLYDKVNELPETRAGVVLGCSPKLADGRPNLYFTSRMDAAAEVWAAGKVNFFILSGDNSEKYYNEPREMYQALVERGVPGDRLVLDYAGFRTLDSMVRAEKVFGQDSFIVISQPFHNERAVALARHFGYDVVGYHAEAVTGAAGIRTMLRERLARVKLLLDLFVLNKQPKFLGEPVTPPKSTPEEKA